MRNAYPLIYCLPEETRAKILGKITTTDVVPHPDWSEWDKPAHYRSSELKIPDVDYDKFIRQFPSRSRG